MSKKSEFIDFISERINEEEMSENVKSYWEALKLEKTKEKPLLTDNGKAILKFLQTTNEDDLYKSKDIADSIGMSSKSVAGAMRKLVESGFVEKTPGDPCLYSVTTNGKNIEIQ